MAWFSNNYYCPDCEKGWMSEWFCGCDDECPGCGRDFEAETSDMLLTHNEQLADAGAFNLGLWVMPRSWSYPDASILTGVEAVQTHGEDEDTFVDRVLNT